MKIRLCSNFRCALVLTVALAVIISGCPAPIKKPPEEAALVRLSRFSYPDFHDDLELDGMEHSILKSLEYLERVPADRSFQFGEDRYDAVHLKKSLQHFLDFIQTNPTDKELKKFIRNHYIVYQSIGSEHVVHSESLYTSYRVILR